MLDCEYIEENDRSRIRSRLIGYVLFYWIFGLVEERINFCIRIELGD